MAYNWYQTRNPGWGTQQYQFGPPPSPNYAATDSWGGQDYYRAHLGRKEDLALYEYAMDRLASGAMGVGRTEAKRWHRHAYGGLGEITRMLPTEIGYAAAYEAYRIFLHHSERLYDVLYGRPDRQREALIATAVAEVQSLWQDTGRAYDEFGLRTAAEAAAAAAAVIFKNHLEHKDGSGAGSAAYVGSEYRRSRRNSMTPSVSSYSSSYSLDPYALDDTALRRSRHGYGDGINRSPYGGGMGGALEPYGASTSMPMAIPSGTPYSGQGSYPASYTQGSIVLPQMSSSYGGVPSSSYGSSYSAAYPQAAPQVYPATYAPSGYDGGYGGSQAAPMMVVPQTRSRGHAHRSHRHRHRSLERYY